MKKLVVLLTVAAALAFCSTTHATITGAWWASDGDGVINCTTGWSPASATLTMDGVQRYVSGYGMTGHMLGEITTDSPLDPTLYLGGSIDNDTGQAWLGYTINVMLSQNFSFAPTFPSVDNPLEPGTGFVAALNQPVLQNSGPWNGYWMGTIIYSQGAGSPIGVGQQMDFAYSITFAGSMSFSYCQEMIPSYTYIPEPSAIVLAGLGGLAFALRLRRNRR